MEDPWWRSVNCNWSGDRGAAHYDEGGIINWAALRPATALTAVAVSEGLKAMEQGKGRVAYPQTQIVTFVSGGVRCIPKRMCNSAVMRPCMQLARITARRAHDVVSGVQFKRPETHNQLLRIPWNSVEVLGRYWLDCGAPVHTPTMCTSAGAYAHNHTMHVVYTRTRTAGVWSAAHIYLVLSPLPLTHSIGRTSYSLTGPCIRHH